MTHTFDSEVSLHYWLLWPMVRQHCRRRLAGGNFIEDRHGAAAAAAAAVSAKRSK